MEKMDKLVKSLTEVQRIEDHKDYWGTRNLPVSFADKLLGFSEATSLMLSYGSNTWAKLIYLNGEQGKPNSVDFSVVFCMNNLFDMQGFINQHAIADSNQFKVTVRLWNTAKGKVAYKVYLRDMVGIPEVSKVSYVYDSGATKTMKAKDLTVKNIYHIIGDYLNTNVTLFQYLDYEHHEYVVYHDLFDSLFALMHLDAKK